MAHLFRCDQEDDQDGSEDEPESDPKFSTEYLLYVSTAPLTVLVPKTASEISTILIRWLRNGHVYSVDSTPTGLQTVR